MTRVLVSLVHNWNPSRTKNSLRNLGEIRKVLLEAGYDVEIAHFDQQPDSFQLQRMAWVDTYKCNLASSKFQFLQVLRREYSNKPPKLAYALAICVYRALGLSSMSLRLHRGIEKIVREKHLSAWHRAKVLNSDFALIMEDDLLLAGSWRKRLPEILGFCKQRKSPSYVDLAGGFPLDVLGLRVLNQELEGGLSRTSKPGANTACAYVISRDFIDEFEDKYSSKSSVKSLGIDFLIDDFLHSSKIQSFHWQGPEFRHGSQEKVFTTWEAIYKG